MAAVQSTRPKLTRRSEEDREEAPSISEEVKRMVEKFMTLTMFDGISSPMDRILHMRTYRMRIRFSTKGEARVVWKGEEICIDKISVCW
jgi:hypothetical protein